jgi:hypothetical protein
VDTNEKVFIVEYNREDPKDLATTEQVSAVSVQEEGDYLYFWKADGTLAGFFLRSVVRSFREVSKNELTRPN